MKDANYLRECFDYDCERGVLIWRLRPIHHFKNSHIMNRVNSRCAGKDVTATSRGYIVVRIDNELCFVHRVIAKMFMGGVDDDLVIDHINGNESDNRISNIRIVSRGANQRNTKMPRSNASGVCGVALRGNSYVAVIQSRKKSVYIGSFDNMFDAVCARKSMERKLSFHENHGRIVNID